MATNSPYKANSSTCCVDLQRYVPAYLTWTASKLSRGASQCYLKYFDLGIESWRCLVLLAIDGAISAPEISRVTGMDKSCVSRCFKSMLEKGLIEFSVEHRLGRSRLAVLTEKGRDLHDQVRDVAMERERAFLEVLSKTEIDSLLRMFRKLHEHLPAVELATQKFVVQRFSKRRSARGYA